MIAIRIDPNMEQTLDALAKAQGKNRSVLVRDALIRYFEDLEDTLLAEEAVREMKGEKPLSELRRELGLDR